MSGKKSRPRSSRELSTIHPDAAGVYWIPVFEILEARGFEVLLVNARDVKNVPGRKTDVNDAQWLQQLHHALRLRHDRWRASLP